MISENITKSTTPVVMRNVLKWDLCTWNLEMWKDFFLAHEPSKTFPVRKMMKQCLKVSTISELYYFKKSYRVLILNVYIVGLGFECYKCCRIPVGKSVARLSP